MKTSNIKWLFSVLAAAALNLCLNISAKADNFVYGGSSPVATSVPPNGDYLALTYPGGTQYAPLGYSQVIGANLIADSGWFASTTEEGPSGDSYVTGNVGGSHLRSFLSFNTTGLQAPVIGASLVLDTYAVFTTGTETVDFLGGVNNLDGNGPSDSTTDANFVLATERSSSPNPSDIATIYSALGVGPLYGSYGYATANSGTQLSVDLDSAFVGDINDSLNSGNSLFTIGTDDVTAVPEPGSFALITIAAPIALRRRRTHYGTRNTATK